VFTGAFPFGASDVPDAGSALPGRRRAVITG